MLEGTQEGRGRAERAVLLLLRGAFVAGGGGVFGCGVADSLFSCRLLVLAVAMAVAMVMVMVLALALWSVG